MRQTSMCFIRMMVALCFLVCVAVSVHAEVVNLIQNGGFEGGFKDAGKGNGYVIWGADYTPTAETGYVVSGEFVPNWTFVSTGVETSTFTGKSSGFYGIGVYNGNGQNVFGMDQGRSQTEGNKYCAGLQTFGVTTPVKSSIQQTVSGLTPGQWYSLRYDFNARSGNAPVMNTYATDAANNSIAFQTGVSTPSNNARFYFNNSVFQATADSMTFVFENNSSGDQSLTFDNIALSSVGFGKVANVVKDGSFESMTQGYIVQGGNSQDDPRTAQFGSSWTAVGTGKSLSTNNTNNSAAWFGISRPGTNFPYFSDNQGGMDGSSVAGLQVYQGNGSATLQQNLTNLQDGKYYAVSYKYNGRSSYTASEYSDATKSLAPVVSSTITDGSGVTQLQSATRTPATNTMKQYAGMFQASGTSATLGITNTITNGTAGSDSCMSLDDVQVVAVPTAPIEAGYTTVHALDMTTIKNGGYNANGIPYAYNAETALANTVFDRIGYYMEFVTSTGEEQYAYVTMDAFTTDVSKIGLVDGAYYFGQNVRNMEVVSNVPNLSRSVPTGGRIEFWRSDYGGSLGVNDTPTSTNPGHGSFQIHDTNNDTTTIMSFSGWGGPSLTGAGLGNNTSVASPYVGGTSVHQDWTFAGNMLDNTYGAANLYTFVHQADAVLTLGNSMISQRDWYGNSGTAKIYGNWNAVTNDTIASIRVSEDGKTWTTLDNLQLNADKTFAGYIDLATGWHELDVQALDASGNILTSSSTKVGVGDVYVVAGQSNAANHGDTKFTATSDNLMMMNYTDGNWSKLADPTVGATGGGGSTWVPFAEALDEQYEGEVPIGIVNVAIGGSPISSWQPGQGGYAKLKEALEKMDGNVAAVLWHQGESDNAATGNDTSEADYLHMLETMINASRTDSGNEDLVWILAQVSYWGNKFDEDVTNAQKAMAENDAYTLLGPDSDALIDGLRAADGVHFNAQGLHTLGEMWAAYALGVPSALPEPSTWAMLLLGMGGLIAVARKRLGKLITK